MLIRHLIESVQNKPFVRFETSGLSARDILFHRPRLRHLPVCSICLLSLSAPALALLDTPQGVLSLKMGESTLRYALVSEQMTVFFKWEVQHDKRALSCYQSRDAIQFSSSKFFPPPLLIPTRLTSLGGVIHPLSARTHQSPISHQGEPRLSWALCF